MYKHYIYILSLYETGIYLRINALYRDRLRNYLGLNHLYHKIHISLREFVGVIVGLLCIPKFHRAFFWAETLAH